MDVFIVATPTQLVNAIEAKHTFPGEKCVLIVLARAFPPQKFNLLIQPGEWDEIHTIAIPTLTGDAEFFIPKNRWESYSYAIRRKLKVDRLSRQLKPVRRLYLGFYEDSLIRHCANKLKYEELWLLDDGTGTLQINQRRSDGEFDKTTSQRTHWKTKFIDQLMGLRTSDVSRLTFFTAYIFEPRPGDQVFQHKYEFLRQASNQAPQRDEVFLLGGPLIERRRMKEENYLKYIKNALTSGLATWFNSLPIYDGTTETSVTPYDVYKQINDLDTNNAIIVSNLKFPGNTLMQIDTPLTRNLWSVFQVDLSGVSTP